MQPGTAPQPQTGSNQQGFYKPETAGTFDNTAAAHAANAPQPPADGVSWEASEYIHHAKTPLWGVGLGAVGLICVSVAIWLGSWTFAVLVTIMTIAVGILAFRPPRILRYSLTADGVKINDTFYKLNDFRAFGILHDGAFYSALLIPTKRFMPALSMYFSQNEGERIIDILGNHLPMQDMQPDFLDNLMRRLRF